MKITKLTLVLSTFLSFFLLCNAFWRLPCRSRSGLARIDPIVNFGAVGAHVHAIHGGSNFGPDATAADLLTSNCTSCAVQQDKSAYWTPALYFMHNNGTTTIVNQVGGMLAYYLLYTDGSPTEKIAAFPNGFQMVAGDTYRRNFTCAIPEPEKSLWTGYEVTQPALRQKALGFNCLNYVDPTKTEGSLERHFLPNKTFIDNNCLDGMRLELMFPSCWNGIDNDSKDHKSHVAYPNLVMTGSCPPGFTTRLPSLFYETIWDTTQFKSVDGQFVLSNGDPTGFGYHGDFIAAWDDGVLQRAVDTCTNLSGQVQDCPVFSLQTDAEASTCAFSLPPSLRVLAADNILGPRAGLPGGVLVQAGPGPATPVVAAAAAAVSTAAVASTTVPASSAAGSPSAAAASSTVVSVAHAITVVTPAPSPTPSYVTTLWSTSAQEVWEILVEVVTVTTTEGGASGGSGGHWRRNAHLGRHRAWHHRGGR